jgi:hypothetical protein
MLDSPRLRLPGTAALPPPTAVRIWEESEMVNGLQVPLSADARENRVHRLPKWYWAITLSDETVER